VVCSILHAALSTLHVALSILRIVFSLSAWRVLAFYVACSGFLRGLFLVYPWSISWSLLRRPASFRRCCIPSPGFMMPCDHSWIELYT